MSARTETCDVAIIGGGMAGLTLALQLNQSSPDLEIIVLERNSLPAPEAAYKVGEATVEIGAHYLAHTLGLKDLLEDTQLRKFGLRLFFGAGSHNDLAKADELGASSLLPAISYQLDRGVLENSLVALLQQRGIDVRDQAAVKEVQLNSAGSRHEIAYQQNGEPRSVSCGWLVDASSRASIIKRKLDIGRPSPHKMSAAWFRLDQEVAVDDWSDNAAWKDRCNGLSRTPSTNHLPGNGYWMWIIPLVGGRTSIGLVSDPAVHSLSSYNSWDKFNQWAETHQPLLAADIGGSQSKLMDFCQLKNLSQDSDQLWSTDQWALTGEAGLFADPFYSPGADFVALNNTLITNLITAAKSPTDAIIHSTVFEKMFHSIFQSTMTLYQDQYGGFGDTRLMVVKTTWDYAYYWSILAWLFFRDVLIDVAFLRTAQSELTRIQALNAKMQAVFRARAAQRIVDTGHGRFFDQIAIPILVQLNTELLESSGDPAKEFAVNCQRLDALAPELLALLSNEKNIGTSSMLGDLQSRLN